ncbi:PepSY domain-containing protein [uncultured Brevundimonas sp.]|uniref:PepSY domain-containing protein n=1 Tax=uncultured Brevundimonas sp. TaxID=213418 RepID=UPI0030EE2EB9|tara:strand:+ start:14356 stop:15081 length:726 start_codon:yes stop_codon:yes gene_type:complete
MNMVRLSTQLHKWIALAVGIQVLFWVAGGLVMTAIPIETVRSEHHVREQTPMPLPLDGVLAPAAVARIQGLALVGAELRTTPRGAAWVLTPVEGEAVTVSAATGQPFPALDTATATNMAAKAYRGDGTPVAAVLLPVAPQETGREGPIWRVDFNDGERTTFYLSPQTGEVVTRRSAVWRFYDFFWRLHIMDLEKGENFNHPLIIAVTFLTFTIVITGFILLWVRVARDVTVWRARRRDAGR